MGPSSLNTSWDGKIRSLEALMVLSGHILFINWSVRCSAGWTCIGHQLCTVVCSLFQRAMCGTLDTRVKRTTLLIYLSYSTVCLYRAGLQRANLSLNSVSTFRNSSQEQKSRISRYNFIFADSDSSIQSLQQRSSDLLAPSLHRSSNVLNPALQVPSIQQIGSVPGLWSTSTRPGAARNQRAMRATALLEPRNLNRNTTGRSRSRNHQPTSLNNESQATLNSFSGIGENLQYYR